MEQFAYITTTPDFTQRAKNPNVCVAKVRKVTPIPEVGPKAYVDECIGVFYGRGIDGAAFAFKSAERYTLREFGAIGEDPLSAALWTFDK